MFIFRIAHIKVAISRAGNKLKQLQICSEGPSGSTFPISVFADIILWLVSRHIYIVHVLVMEINYEIWAFEAAVVVY